MGLDTRVGQKYSILSGAVFLFNLIVGIGAVTMPSGFMAAGVGFSSIILLIIAFMSFMTATWVVESLAISNALASLDHSDHVQGVERGEYQALEDDGSDSSVDETSRMSLAEEDIPLVVSTPR